MVVFQGPLAPGHFTVLEESICCVDRHTDNDSVHIYTTNRFFCDIHVLKRNRNATVLQWKIHGPLFEVLDRDHGSSSVQEKLINPTKHSSE